MKVKENVSKSHYEMGRCQPIKELMVNLVLLIVSALAIYSFMMSGRFLVCTKSKNELK